MNYKETNDNELLYLVHSGNEKAYEELIDKYKYIIVHVLNELTKGVELVGIEKLDLYQEGLIGLITAIKLFDETKETSFYTYVLRCIRSRICGALRVLNRKKNKVLNSSFSLDKLFDEKYEMSLYEVIKDESTNPNKLLLDAEDEREILSKLLSKCSKSEAIIVEYKIKGLSNKEISKLIDKDKKYVENTLFRVSKKYKEVLAKEI